MEGKKPESKKKLIKVTLEHAAFFELVSQANSLIEKRNVTPILSKILIQAKKGSLHIQATDEANSIQGDIPAKVDSQGEMVVDAQSLFDILKELSDGKVQLQEQSGKKLRLSQKVSLFNLIGMKAEEFPSFPPFEIKNSFKIEAGVLKNMLDKSAYCASMDETRYHLNGVFFETPAASKGFCFRFVATDTHRLALAEEPCRKQYLKEGVIIPDKGIRELKKLLSYSEGGDIECAVEPPRILFRHKKTVLSIKLVEGKYPNYQQLIPKKSSIAVTVDSESFCQALRRAALLSATRFKAVTMDMQKNKILMKAEDSERGSAQNEVEMKKAGKDLTVRFNARYVLEVIGSLDSKQVVFEMNGSEFAALVRARSCKKQKAGWPLYRHYHAYENLAVFCSS